MRPNLPRCSPRRSEKGTPTKPYSSSDKRRRFQAYSKPLASLPTKSAKPALPTTACSSFSSLLKGNARCSNSSTANAARNRLDCVGSTSSCARRHRHRVSGNLFVQDALEHHRIDLAQARQRCHGQEQVDVPL